MTLRLLCFSLGIILVGYLPELPSYLFTCSLFSAVVVAAVLLRQKIFAFIWVLTFAAGLLYAIVSGYQLLAKQLADNLAERDIVVEGQIVDLPQENNRRQLFTLSVSKAYSAYEPQTLFNPFPNKINISSYGDLRVKTGEQWRLLVKLKKPRGFVNPGGFDYQASLLRRGIIRRF